LFALTILFSAVLGISSQVFAEGGGGIECPLASGEFRYLEESALLKEKEFDEGMITILYCEYMTGNEEEGTDIYSEIIAVYHSSGTLSEEKIEEYSCGVLLGEQYGETYLLNENIFAAVVYDTPELLAAATEIMSQIEEQNLATTCTIQAQVPSPDDNVEEIIDQQEIIEDIDESELVEKEKPENIEPTIPESAEIVLPDWIKSNAEWWATDLISNDDFSTGIEYMIQENIINVPPTEIAGEASDEIPDWVKQNAGWWSEGLITDSEYVNGLQYLISVGIISVS